MIPSVQNAIWAVDPLQAIYSLATVEQLLRDTVAPRRFTSGLLVFFGLMALLLAAVGIYGVIAQATNQRMREFGLRMALGAGPRDIVTMVVRGALGLAFTGVVVGLVVALGLSQSISSLLFEVAPTDFVAFSAVTLLLLAVAALAAYVPARRATRIDPVTALRAE